MAEDTQDGGGASGSSGLIAQIDKHADASKRGEPNFDPTEDLRGTVERFTPPENSQGPTPATGLR